MYNVAFREGLRALAGLSSLLSARSLLSHRRCSAHGNLPGYFTFQALLLEVELPIGGKRREEPRRRAARQEGARSASEMQACWLDMSTLSYQNEYNN